ncbi:hypothetical protein [Maribacter sp. 2307ULW6-5]|uniref:hypothetical protein n=1 Tax=Maribacter sp. 2307ULW6-5 TaxID=3386275 RepID=UPI0039BD5D2D
MRTTLVDQDISLIQIDVTHCFELHLHTDSERNDTVELQAQMDGEYGPDLYVDSYVEGSTLFIVAGFHLEFVPPEDKLGAHKVVSISLDVNLPAHKKVNVMGTSAHVVAKGSYQELNVALADGPCELRDVYGRAGVRTQSGPIAVYGRAANIRARTKFGSLAANPIPLGKSTLDLYSVTGNIELYKTE